MTQLWHRLQPVLLPYVRRSCASSDVGESIQDAVESIYRKANAQIRAGLVVLDASHRQHHNLSNSGADAVRPVDVEGLPDLLDHRIVRDSRPVPASARRQRSG